MPLDPTEQGFNFAKEIATQVITLSTGLLTLSVTFSKEILRGAAKPRWLLITAWATHLVSILFGVVTLMALTGTLMPADLAQRPNPLQFGGNVRVAAGLQLITFVIGTAFLVSFYVVGRSANGRNEYRVISVAPGELTAELDRLKNDGWEEVSFSVAGESAVHAVLKRPAKSG